MDTYIFHYFLKRWRQKHIIMWNNSRCEETKQNGFVVVVFSLKILFTSCIHYWLDILLILSKHFAIIFYYKKASLVNCFILPHRRGNMVLNEVKHFKMTPGMFRIYFSVCPDIQVLIYLRDFLPVRKCTF
jgi:hypothetical protein